MRHLLFAALLVIAGSGRAFAEEIRVHVYKSPTCGCCTKWIEHLEENGFVVTATDLHDVDRVKADKGVPARLAACHTAIVGEYVVEGHVPAADIRTLLRERPKVTGIAVPGMPKGSPGMESPNPQSYDVIEFSTDGMRVFSHHDAR